MIRYQLKYGIILSLNVSDPYESSSYIFQAPTPELKLFETRMGSDLERSHGLYGKTIGRTTTAVDLAAAMKGITMAYWEPTLIEGDEILNSYEPEKFPPNAIP